MSEEQSQSPLPPPTKSVPSPGPAKSLTDPVAIAMPDRPPDAVLIHTSRGGSDFRDPRARRIVQDMGVALMKLPVTHPPGVVNSIQGRYWVLITPEIPNGHPQHTLNFPHEYGPTEDGQPERYQWFKKDETTYLGFLKPEALKLHQATLATSATTPPPPVPIMPS
jgi:hypothetical protein